MTRRGQDTRSDVLLEHAAALAIGGQGSEAWWYTVARISPEMVAGALGVSRTWLYQLWATKEDFWRDLVVHECRRQEPVTALLERTSAAAAAATSPTDEVRAVMSPAAVPELPGLRTSAGLVAYRLPEVVRDVEVCRSAAARRLIAAWMRGWCLRWERRPIDGLGLADIVDALALVWECTMLASVTTPWSTRPDWRIDDHGAEWSMPASIAQIVLDRLTEAGDPAEHEQWVDEPNDTPRMGDAPDERREMALQTASELLAAGPMCADDELDSVGWLTVARLARVARHSRQAVYNRWRCERDLRVALLRHLCRRYRHSGLDATRAAGGGFHPNDVVAGLIRTDLLRPVMSFAPCAGAADVQVELTTLWHRAALELGEQHCVDDGSAWSAFGTARRGDALLFLSMGSRRMMHVQEATAAARSSPPAVSTPDVLRRILDVMGRLLEAAPFTTAAALDPIR